MTDESLGNMENVLFRSDSSLSFPFNITLSNGMLMALLLIEPARADSLTTAGGLRVAQLLGLAAVILALWRLRTRFKPSPDEIPQT